MFLRCLARLHTACALFMFAPALVRAAPSTTIDVDPSRAQGAVAPQLFGVNHRYLNDGQGTWHPDAQDCAPAFNDVVDYMAPTVMRYPGGTIANLFDWKRAIGSVRK